jgi:hypothetical protein
MPSEVAGSRVSNGFFGDVRSPLRAEATAILKKAVRLTNEAGGRRMGRNRMRGERWLVGLLMCAITSWLSICTLVAGERSVELFRGSSDTETGGRYIGQNKPVCVNEFLDGLDRTLSDVTCRVVVRQIVLSGLRNVRLFYCPAGTIEGRPYPWMMYNGVFISKRIFITVAHNFHRLMTPDGARSLGPPLPDAYVRHCGVSAPIPSESKRRVFIDLRVPPMTGDAASGWTDFAVAMVSEAVEDVQAIELANEDDILRRTELWAVSAYRGASYAPAEQCFM